MTTQRRAILYITLTTLLWGLPSLFIHYFASYLDADSQNFWRYLAAMAFLLLYGWWSGEEVVCRQGQALIRVAVTAALLVAYQYCYTESLYYAKPALVSLLIQLELIVAISLSCLFFPDERRVARSPWFILGACAAMAGAVGMVVFSRECAAAEAQPADWAKLAFAVSLVVGAAALWGAYSVAVKWSLEQVSPFSLFTNVATLAALFFLMLAGLQGRPGAIAHMSAGGILAVIGSGIACIAVAQVLYLSAIRGLGVGICNTVILASPIVAVALSPFLFGEQLTWLQVLSAIVLLSGAVAAVRANGGRRKASEGLAKRRV